MPTLELKRVPDETTVTRLCEAKEASELSWRWLARLLGFDAQPWAARLSAVARGKPGCISEELENVLRIRLGLDEIDWPTYALAPVCPTCGAIHAVGDCGGVQGKAVILPSDAEVRRKPTPRKRAKAYRPWLPASAGVLIRSEAERRGVSVAVVILGALGISVENL